MVMRSLTTALIGGAVLAAFLAPAGTAYAAAVTIADETSDVWEDSAEDGAYVTSAQVTNVDVESLRVRHLANRIVVTADYVELAKGSDVPLGVTNRLRFDDGPALTISIDTFHKASGESALYNKRGPVECGGYDATIDYAADTVELIVPRRCVGNPRWVEANFVSQGSVESSDAENGYLTYRDNALSSESGAGGWTERVRRG
jgi:hypothetical protein